MPLPRFLGFMDSSADPADKVRFEQQIRESIRFAGVVRVFAVGLVALLLTATIGSDRLWYYLLLCFGFLLFGLIPFILSRRVKNPARMQALFAVFDAILLVWMLMVPDPTFAQTTPIQLQLKFQNHLYLFLLLCGSAFCYSPALVLWTGFCLSVAWSVAVLWIASLPSSFTDVQSWRELNLLPDGSPPPLLDAILHPNFVNIALLVNEVALLTIMSLVLAGAVYRQRLHLERQARAEGERQNLSRYFSPNLVDRMSRSRDPFATVDRHKVAIIFADLNGFTRYSETAAPEEVVELLRRFHGDMADAIFANGGTLDKYLGDGVMATFGTPEARPDDPVRALRCVKAMRHSVARWAKERETEGKRPLTVGIGAHYGEAVVGNVGNERRLEFTVIGDNVNVASRLEDLKSTLDSGLILSEELVDAARQAGASEDLFESLEKKEDVALHGRQEPVTIYRAVGRS